MVTATDLVNRAIQLIGDDQEPVTGVYPTFDSSAAGVAAATLYAGCVQTIARQFGWDFSRNIADLVSSGNTPPFGFTSEYLYPTNGIQVRQIVPKTQTDVNNPLPINWVVGNAMVSGLPKKVIWTDLTPAQAVFTNQPTEDLWDADYTEAVVRLLASEFAMALAGKPDTARDTLEQSAQFANIGQARSDT